MSNRRNIVIEHSTRIPSRRLSAVKHALAVVAIMLPVLSAKGAGDYEILRGQAYAQRSSGALTGDLYLPVAGEAVPAVVMIHGGGWRSGEVDDMAGFAESVVQAGFAVFNITYRLAPDHRFPAQLEDVREAVRWLRANAAKHHIDAARIGAWGYSAGAHLAMLLGVVDDDVLDDAAPSAPSARVSVVVAGAGPTNLSEYPDNRYVATLMPDDAGESLFALASPLASVSQDDAPMFLYHGKRDMIVGYHNSVNMHQALRDAGVEARLYELRFGHIVSYLFGKSAVRAGIEFLKKRL